MVAISTKDPFVDLLNEIKTSSSKVKSGEWTLSDYYFRMTDYFNQIEPSTGTDQGIVFDFKKDAEEFRLLAKKTIVQEEV